MHKNSAPDQTVHEERAGPVVHADHADHADHARVGHTQHMDNGDEIGWVGPSCPACGRETQVREKVHTMRQAHTLEEKIVNDLFALLGYPHENRLRAELTDTIQLVRKTAAVGWRDIYTLDAPGVR